MNIVRIFLACTALAVCGVATAQYQWIDNAGRKIFSDRPPPADIPEKNVLKQPGAATSALPAGSAAMAPPPAPSAADGSNSDAEAVAAKPSASAPGVDKLLEEKKKQAEATEAAKKAEEEKRIAALRAENCRRAQAAKAGLESGVRIARTNAKGEREILDDSGRAEEMRRTQAVIQSECS